MIIAISGLTFDPKGNKGSAGAGKDTVADRLVAKHGFVRIGFADPMKRFLAEVFDFSEEQLWGPSEKRNAPDERYLQGHRNIYDSESIRVAEDGRFLAQILAESEGRVASEEELRKGEEENFEKESCTYLTPRHALQQLGTEFGRACYEDVWVAYAMRVAQTLLKGTCLYDPAKGLIAPTERDTRDRDYVPWGASIRGVVFNDLRFKNEMEYIKQNGGKVVRVRRPVEEVTISASHPSENDLNDVPDDAFDYVIHGQPNDVHDLQMRTDEMMDGLNGHIAPFDEAQKDIPPFLRK